jgi:hypothetical protein
VIGVFVSESACPAHFRSHDIFNSKFGRTASAKLHGKSLELSAPI